jgi:hypothetical protein
MKNQFVKILLSLFAINAILCSAVYAQRKVTDPKHEFHYKVSPLETDEVSIYFIDSHSQQEFTATKIRVNNKTNDYIFYKTAETTFKYEFGEFHPTVGGLFRGANMVVRPRDSDTRVLKITGGNEFHVESLGVILNGFSRVAAEGKTQDAPDFKLPAAVNDFKAGNFKVTLEKIRKETKVTEAVFNCIYQGNDVGIVDATKVVLKLENGQEYANDQKKNKAEIVLPGDETKIAVSFHVPGKVTDMQFANMLLQWKDTFTESKITPITVGKVEFVLDPGLTEAKNK